MKNNRFFSILLMALILSFTFVACDKEDDMTDKDAPVIILTEPVDGGEFANGEEIHIEGTVTDESLHEFKIEIKNNSTGAVLFSESPTVHDKTSYDFHTHYEVNGITEHTEATLTIEVADHSDNITKKTLTVHLKP
jgi:hypothetical protein